MSGHARPCAALLLAALAAIPLTGCEFSRRNRDAQSLFDVLVAPPSGDRALELATDPFDADARTRGVVRLARSQAAREPATLDLYLGATTDEDAAVRRAAALALAAHGLPRHAPALVDLLDDEDATVRQAAARALQFIHDPDAAEPLAARIDPDRETDPLVRAAAAEALGQYPEPAVALALVDAIDERDLAVNFAAARSLETLTGQNFGLDLASWVNWFDRTDAPFLAGRAYEYPGYTRDRLLTEYILFWKAVPNRPSAPPRGSPFDRAPEDIAPPPPAEGSG